MAKRPLNDAAFCRAHGINVNDAVSGNCPIRGTVEIRVTAIGESAILARRRGAAEGHNWNLGEWADVFVFGKSVRPGWERRAIPAPASPARATGGNL